MFSLLFSTKRFFAFVFSALALAVPVSAFAHCPLCTAGAGALAVLAASIGVSPVVVGLFIGAFAIALGLWAGRMVKRKYVSHQKTLIAAAVFIGTVVPLMPLIQSYGPFYVSLGGEYGTLFHNTYAVNLFVFGSLLGALVMLAGPQVSRVFTALRGSQLPYQGISFTFGILVLVSLIIQFF